MTLQQMLTRQHKAQLEAHGLDLPALNEQERIWAIRWNILALEDELHEALGETGWKPWASSRHFNRDAFVSELVDAWHFLMNLFLIAGVDAEELTRAYNHKRDLNDARQRAGYDGVSTKCPNCGRALDDQAVTCTEKGCAR